MVTSWVIRTNSDEFALVILNFKVGSHLFHKRDIYKEIENEDKHNLIKIQALNLST